ncbi:MAG TPA: YncE family protein [Granulicella sp.]
MHLAGIAADQTHRAGKTVSRTTRFLHAAALAALGAAGFLSLAGCGNNYRPVLTAINPVGPSAQPEKYAVVLSDPGNNNPGIVTLVDFSGDTVVITANVGVSPKYLILGTSGAYGYVINGDNTINNFSVINSLITSQVLSTTLPSGSVPTSIFPQSANIYVSDPGTNSVDQLRQTTGSTTASGTPIAFNQGLPVTNPTFVFGIPTANSRGYVLSSADSQSGGAPTAVGIDTATNTLSAHLPVGVNPVYGVMTADGKRAFVMNKGDNTISVINAQANTLDTTPATGSSIVPVGVGPIWADFAPTLNEVVVANAGDGSSPGSLSLVSIPLCNASSVTSNPNCDANNPVDANGFGTLLKDIPVGVNPVMVSALQDGTRAYVANAGNSTTEGSVSVVDLNSQRVTTTIPLSCHPNYIAATTGSPTGKVYVTCPDSKDMTVIRTDTDSIDLTIPLQGTGVSVRVSAQ